MSAPIFVTGLPRSGTSLVAGVLAVSGAWTGATKGPSPENRKGSFENEVVKDRFVKPVLALLGADPLGLDPLPATDATPPCWEDQFRDLVLTELARQGWDGRQTWLLKEAKLALVWRLWAGAFPEARWVVVRRCRDAILASALRAEPMARRLGYDWARWKSWAAAYLAHLEELAAGVEVAAEVWPERDIFEDLQRMRPVVEGLGLIWRPDVVADWVDARLWHGEVDPADN